MDWKTWKTYSCIEYIRRAREHGLQEKTKQTLRRGYTANTEAGRRTHRTLMSSGSSSWHLCRFIARRQELHGRGQHN